VFTFGNSLDVEASVSSMPLYSRSTSLADSLS